MSSMPDCPHFRLKYELQEQGEVVSLISLLAWRMNSVQDAIDTAFEMVRCAVASLDALGERLMKKFEADEKTSKDLRNTINAYRCACTGNLNWRYVVDC